MFSCVFILTLKQISWKPKTFFKKLVYCSLVESTKIENISFLCKATLSEADVKTNRIESIKVPIKKNEVLPVTTFFFFWKFCFSLKISYKELIWCTAYPNVYIHMCIFINAAVLFEGAFSLWVSLKLTLK